MDLTRKLIAPGALSLALVLCFAGTAFASPRASVQATSSPTVGVGLPITPAQSMTTPPPGFSTNARQAIKAAEANGTMFALHGREHPLVVEATVWNDQSWFVDFYYHGKRTAEVVENRAGRVTGVWTGPLAVAVYARGDFLPLFGSWWVLIPMSLLFLVPFIDARRPCRMLHFDALAIESLLVSYLLFDHASLVPAVWTAYPPMLYLLARMLWIGVRHRSGAGAGETRRRLHAALAPVLSARVLGAGLIALVAFRTGLSLVEHDVSDVGYASVIGAHRIASGQSLYYASTAHGDTYGPVAYLAYLPFELLFPWRGAWDYLPSAHAASIAFDWVTILCLVVLGRRLREGREGLRLGLALGWAWAACPFTLLALMAHSNDGLLALLSVLGLLTFDSAAARGAVLGLATAAKFAPAALLPLFASGRRQGIKGALVCLASFAVVVGMAIGVYLPSGGLAEFYNHTIGFQLSRPDVFSPWALHPSLDPLKSALEVGVLALCAGVAFSPRRRSVAQVCALAAAITIAVELPAEHWFYYFIVWFMPFVLVGLFARDGDGVAVNEEVADSASVTTATEVGVLEPVHAGA